MRTWVENKPGILDDLYLPGRESGQDTVLNLFVTSLALSIFSDHEIHQINGRIIWQVLSYHKEPQTGLPEANRIRE